MELLLQAYSSKLKSSVVHFCLHDKFWCVSKILLHFERNIPGRAILIPVLLSCVCFFLQLIWQTIHTLVNEIACALGPENNALPQP